MLIFKQLHLKWVTLKIELEFNKIPKEIISRNNFDNKEIEHTSLLINRKSTNIENQLIEKQSVEKNDTEYKSINNQRNENQRNETDQKNASFSKSLDPVSMLSSTQEKENLGRYILDFLLQLPRVESKLEYNDNIEPFNLLISPYVESYKKHFYFNMSTGLAINDNYGPSDNYFSILKSKEFMFTGGLAYQFSASNAVELSYSQFDHSVGYSFEGDPRYLRKSGFSVRVIKAALVSNIWSPFEGLQIKMSNGIAAMTGGENTFSNGSSSPLTPDLIKSAELVKIFNDTKTHFMYSSGLSMDLEIVDNLEFTFAAEYTHGYKQRSYTRLNYLEGEGVNKNVESLSDGSFYSFTLGLKYRLQKGSTIF